MRVHQVLSGAGPRDAITAEALQFRRRFADWGWGGRDHAARLGGGLGGAILPLERLDAGPQDLLLLHHSAHTPRLDELLALPNPKLLLYHNITPAEWLWDHAPVVAAHCAVGRDQLGPLVAACRLAAADSRFNARELEALGARAVEVIPLLLDHHRLGAPAPAPPPGPPVILFVGRLSPHKRQDEVIRAFSLYRARHAPEARLVLVGEPLSPEYLRRLRALADELAPGAVSIESGLDERSLGERYRAAHVFLCLSAHEGFCIPLVEAFHFGLPVIARPAGAISEVAGDAAVLVEDPDLAVVAELIHLAVSDSELRAELAKRGRRRLTSYSPEAVAGRLRHAVEAAAGRSGPSVP